MYTDKIAFPTLWPLVIGALSLLLPSYWTMAAGAWQMDAYAHGPIVLVVLVWLFWRQRAAVLEGEAATRSALVVGWGLLIGAALLYTVGRSQVISVLEMSAEIPLVIGVLLVLRGWPALRALWFPILFMAFLIPLPSFIIDAITGSLKAQVSAIVESGLYALGYPIARTGVVLTIGPYQLMVADACSGLHSLYSLTAMGTLYLYLMRRAGVWRNLILVASILPIAFLANVVRVVILVLITYYFGDAAGQGFVHGLAGIVLFVVALGLLFLLDLGLGLVMRGRPVSLQVRTR